MSGGRAGARARLETAVLEMICEHLRGAGLAERASAACSFSEIGGDSVIAAEIVVAVRTQLGIDVELASFFDGRSLRELAARVASDGET